MTGRLIALGAAVVVVAFGVSFAIGKATASKDDGKGGSAQLAAIPVPALVIHAPDDREVSRDDARDFAGAGDHVRLYWARGLGHRRILADPEVVAEAVGFAAARPRLMRVN